MPAPTQEEVTLGDKNVELSQFMRYKGAKDRTDRIAILNTKLLRAWRYYHQTAKRSFRAPTNPDILKLCKEALGEPEQRFGLVLFQYNTDTQGNLIDATKCQGSVKVWSISEPRYVELSNLHNNWPLMDSGFGAKQCDVLVKCSEEKFQRMQFTPTPEAHWKTKEAWYKALKEKEAKALPVVRKALGNQLTDAEIMELIGAAPKTSPTGTTENVGDVDLSDVLDDQA